MNIVFDNSNSVYKTLQVKIMGSGTQWIGGGTKSLVTGNAVTRRRRERRKWKKRKDFF